ncbi:MAG TPA: RsmG family class I SAM-dependent methyltransferase [Actinomycetota bacterium]|nr:RsmG family class I SAM-dependent methyltransferase [Actinomycetota bacterium]
MKRVPPWLSSLAPAEALPSLLRFAELLTGPARRLGLVGFPESQILEQIARALLLNNVLEGRTFVDVGSGGGLPGLPLAIVNPGKGTLVEPRSKAVGFLEKAVRDLRLDVRVIRSRAQEWADVEPERAESAVARALAAPRRASQLCSPLVVPGGLIVLTSGEEAAKPNLDDFPGIASIEVEKLRASIDISQSALIMRKHG